eukprot:gene11920-24971_t
MFSPTKVNVILGTMSYGAQTSKDVALQQISAFKTSGYDMIDTARMYVHGRTEEILGDIFSETEASSMTFRLASKVNPFPGYNENLKAYNDHNTPLEETLEAMQELYLDGKFTRLGLSNYAANLVRDVHKICLDRDWVLPSVYQ